MLGEVDAAPEREARTARALDLAVGGVAAHGDLHERLVRARVRVRVGVRVRVRVGVRVRVRVGVGVGVRVRICTSASDLPTYARMPRLRKLKGGAAPLSPPTPLSEYLLRLSARVRARARVRVRVRLDSAHIRPGHAAPTGACPLPGTGAYRTGYRRRGYGTR